MRQRGAGGPAGETPTAESQMKADPERIYRTVYELQGVKNPITAPAALDRAAEYLFGEMSRLGLNPRRQEFTIGDDPQVFANIEGQIGPLDAGPGLVVVSHYDTVPGCPGANDNAAGVAVGLEIGRLLARLDDPPPVSIVAVTLEESSSPLYAGTELESALRHGVKLDDHRFCNWQSRKLMGRITKRAIELYEGTVSQGEGFRIALEEQRAEEVPANVRAHIEDLVEIYRDVTKRTAIGTRSRIGSDRWLEESLAAGRRPSDCIVLDEVGIFRHEPGTQRPSPMVDFDSFTSSYRLDPQNRTGDFIVAAAISGASHLAQRFADSCRLPGVDLPFGVLDLPVDFEHVVEHVPKGLGSDHAAFWREGIPALFIFDSADARDDWSHSPADVIGNLDFGRLAQLTDAVVATIRQVRHAPAKRGTE